MPDDAHDRRSAQLLDEAMRRFEAAWDDERGMVSLSGDRGVFHDPRASLGYARALLQRDADGDRERAARAVRNVLSMQERREQDEHYGNFRWLYEDEAVDDLNAVEFMLDGLIPIAREHADRLPAELVEEMHEGIAIGLDEIDRLDVHPSYTNIALSDICNSVLGGELLGEEEYVERGALRLDEWFEYTNRSGAPHEFNSPTYLGVDIARMAALAEHTQDERIALKARVAEERLWLHVAAHYHPGLAQLAGPHSRSYRDGWTGAGGNLKLALWHLLGDDALRRETPFFPGGREEGHLGNALEPRHCPPYVAEWLRERRFPFESLETADAAAGLDLATYMTKEYALGTASKTWFVGDPPEVWPGFNSSLLYFRREGDPGYGVLYVRYIVNDRAAGGMLVHQSDRASLEHWEEGRFVAAQHRNRAIVAYGLQPRLRAVHSNKLSVRMLGVSAETEVWVGDERAGAFPRTVDPGEPVVIGEGDAYIAVIPLDPSDMGSDAPIELDVREGMLTLDIYNYKGPAKGFWEYRSLGGPFYRGNVRNAFVLEVAGRSEYQDVAAFRTHIAGARLADSVDERYEREIVYASEGGSVTLRYNLRDFANPGAATERAFDGGPYVAPMAQAGTPGDGGPSWVQTRDSLVEAGRVRLLAGRAPKWLFADDERRRYIFVNPSDEYIPVWLETPDSVVECEAFGFGRIVLDEQARTVEVEAANEIAPLRIRAADGMRLSLNGTDVTERLVGGEGGRADVERRWMI
jgi:hypothetical protein